MPVKRLARSREVGRSVEVGVARHDVAWTCGNGRCSARDRAGRRSGVGSAACVAEPEPALARILAALSAASTRSGSSSLRRPPCDLPRRCLEDPSGFPRAIPEFPPDFRGLSLPGLSRQGSSQSGSRRRGESGGGQPCDRQPQSGGQPWDRQQHPGGGQPCNGQDGSCWGCGWR
jgi:hypothetical protein